MCNENEELKNKLQKVTDLSKINMADKPNGNCHEEKRIQLNLCQANMATLSASKWIEAERQIQELASSFNEISILCNHIRKSIEASEAYSYQFNIKIVVSGDKDVYIMGDFNIDLLKCESSQISQDFLLSLRSCYLIPTVDKATSVHRTSATLIDDTFVNNPDPLFASGNIISDISDHFSQFCITTSAKDKLQQGMTMQFLYLSKLTRFQ